MDRLSTAYELALQQQSQWRGACEELKLANDQLKFEVISTSENSASQIAKLTEELEQVHSVLRQSTNCVEQIKAENEIELKRRNDELYELKLCFDNLKKLSSRR